MDKIYLLSKDNCMALLNLSIHYTWRNAKTLSRNDKFKISETSWDEVFELPDGSYSISNIQNYFECIIKKQESLTDKPPVEIYVNVTWEC